MISDFTLVLAQLTSDLLASKMQQDFENILASNPFDYEALYRFDLQLGGPSVKLINDQNKRGRYQVDDRDILRPIQYLAMSFEKAQKVDDLAWYAREIVEMSCVHIEGLVKNIARTPSWPMGKALRSPIARLSLPSDIWEQINRLTLIYNASKHDFSHDKDTHLFSPQDAVRAFVSARQLGLRLYPLAHLKTEMSIFNVGVSSTLDS